MGLFWIAAWAARQTAPSCLNPRFDGAFLNYDRRLVNGWLGRVLIPDLMGLFWILVHKIEWKFLKMKKFLVVIVTVLTLASCSTIESNRANVFVEIYGRNDNINFTVVSNSVGLYQTPYGNNTTRLNIRLHWTCLIIQQNKTATVMLMSDGQKTVD